MGTEERKLDDRVRQIAYAAIKWSVQQFLVEVGQTNDTDKAWVAVCDQLPEMPSPSSDLVRQIAREEAADAWTKAADLARARGLDHFAACCKDVADELDPPEPNLLPCPWCGGPAEIEEDDQGLFHVGCTTRQCKAEPKIGAYDIRDNAIAAWNTRK